MIIQINTAKPQTAPKAFALFNLGFRPFFLGASVFAILSILLWLLVYFAYVPMPTANFSLSQWHAHEMLYGYSLAVVAGFLLTAVKNWTGIPTVSGRPLILLFLLWCIARVLFMFGARYLAWVAAADVLFGLLLCIAIAQPIYQAKQWKQAGVVAKVLLLWIGNILFYLGCFGLVAKGMQYAINGAVLLMISLILMVGRRVIPFFIERGTSTKIQLKQHKWLDMSILVLFISLFLNEIFIQNSMATMSLAWALFALNGYRLWMWHIWGIWQVPLLWSLYASAWLINMGFLFYGWQTQDPSLSILTTHLFTIGGIGLMTLSMMARVALGHTGRDIRKPSRWISMAFFGLLISVLLRSILPIFNTSHYMFWVLAGAIFWVISYASYVAIYAPILINPRADGAAG